MRHNKDTNCQLSRVWKRTFDSLTESLSEAASRPVNTMVCISVSVNPKPFLP